MTTAQMKTRTKALKVLLELMKLWLGPQILRLIICVYNLGTVLKMRTPLAFLVTQVCYPLMYTEGLSLFLGSKGSDPFCDIRASPIRDSTITPRYPTPPQADRIENSFTSSLVFDKTIPNPWTTAS